MDKSANLLSFRFSKKNPLNKARRSKLTREEIDAKTGSHDACPGCGVTKGFLISKVERAGFWCDTVVCSGCDLVFNDSYILEPLEYYASVFGKQKWQEKRKFVSFIWERVHNRVTANVLNRIKQLSEWRIETIQENKI